MENHNKTIQLAMVDNDELMVNLLSDYFNQNTSINPMFIAFSGFQFLDKMEQISEYPDVVLIDLKMENGSGLDVLKAMSQLNYDCKIIIMSSYYNSSYMGQMLKLGCDAFIPKEIDPEELVEVIQQVHYKGHYFTEDQIYNLRKQVSPKSPKLHLSSKESLTERELEVLELLCQQFTSKEIAERLFVSVKTIEMHKSNLLLKTGVKNSVGLVIYAVQNKLVNPDDLILLD